MDAYNLFRRREETGVVCAVPEDRAVPGFLQGQAWEFAGKVDGRLPPPIGFDRRAASSGVRFNGFYLFQAFSGQRRCHESGLMRP
jgi:hypothetical protein